MYKLEYDPELRDPIFGVDIPRAELRSILNNKMGERRFEDVYYEDRWRVYRQDGEDLTQVTDPIPNGIYPATVESVPCVLVVIENFLRLYYKSGDSSNLIKDIKYWLNEICTD